MHCLIFIVTTGVIIMYTKTLYLCARQVFSFEGTKLSFSDAFIFGGLDHTGLKEAPLEMGFGTTAAFGVPLDKCT